MTHTDQLVLSGRRLKRQSLLFIEQTRHSGGVFVSEARAASVAFGDEITAATQKLAATTGRSAGTLQRAFRKEAVNWRNLAIKTRDAYLLALRTQVSGVEDRATVAREALRPAALQTSVLRATHDLLGGAQGLVDQRLQQATQVRKRASRATTPAKRRPTRKTGHVPIRNYDRLTAKDVVERIQRLSGRQATALLDYEQAGKNRATVIRAAKQRLAAN
ncbi:MAG: hypothetical protein OEM15_05450 [Myxococcales bacterium]|nr:hypothetical protein [Myxococcales bacterium]MDH3484787.1 hypothetical protein [Myxococcales bacterium]